MRYHSRFSRPRMPVKTEINMTSLIDVMMSLLAIFMITAPLITSGIPLTLPKGDGKTFAGDDKSLDISVDKNGTVFLGQQQVSLKDLSAKVGAIIAENPRIQVVISGDRASHYGQVIEVMALLRAAGFQQVGLKTDAQTMQVGG